MTKRTYAIAMLSSILPLSNIATPTLQTLKPFKRMQTQWMKSSVMQKLKLF